MHNLRSFFWVTLLLAITTHSFAETDVEEKNDGENRADFFCGACKSAIAGFMKDPKQLVEYASSWCQNVEKMEAQMQCNMLMAVAAPQINKYAEGIEPEQVCQVINLCGEGSIEMKDVLAFLGKAAKIIDTAKQNVEKKQGKKTKDSEKKPATDEL